MRGRDATALEGLRAECERLRQQLDEAQQALALSYEVDRAATTTRPSQANPNLHPEERPSPRPLLEDALQGVGLLAASGHVIHANRRLATLMETTQDRLIGSHLSELMPGPLNDSVGEWLDRANRQPVQASHRVPARSGVVRHLHFTVNRLSAGTDAALSLVVTDLDQIFDRGALRAEAQEIDTLDQSLDRARTEARNLLESAMAAHSRAEAIKDALEREIDHRKRAEAALQDTEQRYNRMMEAIGDTHWLSTADWQTVLYLGSTGRAD